MGPVQLPAERDVHHADPGPDHGQHGRLQAGEVRRAAAAAAARGVPRRVPAGRRQHGLRRGAHGHPAADGLGPRRLPGLHRHGARGRRHSRSSTRRRTGCARVLGLDAKNPAIVLADADLDLALSECLLGRALVQRPALHGDQDPLRARRALRALPGRAGRARGRAASAGDPWEPGVQITPLPERGQDRVPGRPRGGRRARGARVVNPGGGRVEGTLVLAGRGGPGDAPTCGSGARSSSGPVVPVVPFTDVAEPLRYIVASNYGQQVSLFGRDPAGHRRPDRPAGQPGQPREPQQPVPARARRLPVHGPQGLGRGHAVGVGRAAGVLDPRAGGGEGDRREQGARDGASCASASRTGCRRTSCSERASADRVTNIISLCSFTAGYQERELE